MLRTKEDVVRHADDILRKARTETERKSRCFFIAQLFSKIKEFEQVKHYVQQYLSIKPDSSPAYKLLAQAYEGLGQLDNAVIAYENSLKFDPAQAELLLKICELYSDNNVNFDPQKVKSALDKTEKCFPHHSVVFNLKEKLMANGTDTDRDEYEKLLNVEMKSRPNDCSVRIKMLTLYLETDRVELAYVTSCEIENKGLFKRRLEWYECFDSVCDAYRKMYHAKCGSTFYSYWLHVLDLVCSLTYSVEFKKSLNDCFTPICKFDKILNEASKINETGSGFKDIIDHFSAQLSFHLSNIISKKAKEDSDYSSDLLKIQIWSERKTKIGSLLLFAIKNGVSKASALSSMMTMKENQFKLYEARIHQSKTRFIEAYYTLNSLAKNHNQGEKQFIDSVNFYTSGPWRNDIYKIFSQLSDMNQADSYFMHSNFFRDIPQKFPSLNEINPSFYESFELTYNGSLHHMIWLGLRTISNLSDPFATKIDAHLRTTIFKGLSLTTNLSSCGIESLNQLDVDSFLYLTLLCKALSIKQRGPDQPVTMPSSITSYLINEKEERWWNKICVISRNTDKDEKCDDMKKYSNSDNSDVFQTTRLEVQKVLEQIRGNNLQLPLIIHLARTFTKRSAIEHGDVQDACDKRALYLWDLVVINLKGINNKLNSPSINNQKRLFFNYDVSNLTHSEVNMINTEACLFTGSYFIRCRLFNKALDILKLAQTPESLYKQALIYETLSIQDIETLRADEITSELRAKQATFAGKARDCLGQAVDMIKSSGDRNHSLMNQITEKLNTIDRLLCHIKSDNNDEENNGFAYNSEGSASLGSSDVEGTMSRPAPVSSGRNPKPIPTSTPRRWRQEFRSNALTTNAVDLIELLTLHQNTNQLKLQRVVETTKLASDRIESIASEQKTIKNMIEDLSNRLGKLETDTMTNFNDLKKEVKQKPDLYNMLDDVEYNAEEVLNFPNMSNYFPRGGNVSNIANAAVAYPPAATAIPASAYFPPNSLYQGNVPFYGQSPFGETQQMADYLRTFAMTSQRGNSLTNLQAGLPLQSTIVGAQNLTGLPHLQVPAVSSPPIKNTTSSQQAPNNVVITTSDALPTNVPTTAPTLFVNIPPEHRLGSAPATTSHPIAAVIAPHKFQIPMPSNFKLVEKSPVADPAEDKNIEATLDVSKDSDTGTTITEHDPLPNFKPIIPLPDEVEVKTGEENETVIFDCRAKLFRFVDKEWKERGLGQLKILKSKDDKPHFRIIMRREQVHKICANHFITEDMKLVKPSNNDKSYIWWAHDFADEKVEVEKFLARFKTVEDGELFKRVFEEAKQAVEGMSSNTSTPKSDTKFSRQKQLVKTILTPPKLSLSAGNQENKSTSFSAAADTKSKISIGGFTFSSQPKLTDVSKEKDSENNSAEKSKPTGLFTSFSFGNSKTDDKSQGSLFSFSSDPASDDGKSETPKEEKCENNSHFSTKLMEFLRPEAGSWECYACYTRNKPESRSCVSCETPHQSTVKTSDKTAQSTKPVSVIDTGNKTEQSSNLPSLSSMFKPPQGSWSCDVCLVRNKAETTLCMACGTVKPGCTAVPKSAPVQTFSFGIPPSNTPVTGATNVASFPPIAKASDTSSTSSVDSPKSLPVFGSTDANSSIFSFGMPSTVTSPSNFTFGSAKFNFTIKTPTKGSESEEKSPHTTPKSAHKSDADESDNEHEDEDKDHTEGIYFQPVVDLPDKIDVKTGEEDELVLYSQRSKLFRYVAKCKEWKERGLGDVKILKHKVSGKIRLLMRREPVMKLCLNHYVTSDIEMKAKDPKSWIWCAADFSEGEQTIEKFCIRFKTPDIAQEFKQKFDCIKNNPDESSPILESDDVVFVSETQIVSDELKAKALALQLPANFYKYLNSPGCQGCRGCENDSDDCSQVSSTSDSQSKTPWFAQNSGTSGIAQNSPMYFGSKALSTPPISNSSSFGGSSNVVQVTPSPAPGAILPGNSLFGGGAVKPSVFSMVQSTPESQMTPKDKTVAFTPPTSNVSKSQDVPKTQSQISTFSFASALPANATGAPSATPVFSFSPQNSVFGGSSGSFFGGQTLTNTAPVFGGQSAITPTNTSVLTGPPLGSVNPSPSNPASFWNVTSTFDSPLTTESTLWSTSSQSPIFGSATSFAKTDQSQSATPIFGSSSTTLSTPEAQKNTELNISQEPKEELAFLNKGSSISFSSIVAQAPTTNTFVGDNSSFKWEGAGATIFGAKKTDSTDESVNRTKDNDDETAEKDDNQDEHDPYFEPIVPLPDKIELKTGEEDEDIIFSERAKLYRRDPITKEWKERGVGLMKLLEHRDHKTHRLLMRREQVHKVVCNHRITSDLKLNPIKNSENSYCWAAMNLSQDCTEPASEVLSIKFKNRDLAVRFKEAFEEAQICAEEASPTKN